MPLSAIRQSMLKYRDAIAPSRTIAIKVGAYRLPASQTRIQRLSDSQRLLVPGVSETSTVFRVRYTMRSLPQGNDWALSFDDGVTWSPVRVLGSAYRDAGNNAWVFNVERGA